MPPGPPSSVQTSSALSGTDVPTRITPCRANEAYSGPPSLTSTIAVSMISSAPSAWRTRSWQVTAAQYSCPSASGMYAVPFAVTW
jgi:hypothetical protein